jgi:hypothetical protein
MPTKVFEFDFNGASPLQVFDTLGDVMFDARYGCFPIAQHGAVAIGPRTVGPPLSSGTNSSADIALARNRGSKVPIYTVIAETPNYNNLNNRANFQAELQYTSTGNAVTQVLGYWVVAWSSTLRIGNVWANISSPISASGTITAYYLIFENSAG